jgi:alpha-L-fucosidase
MIRIILLFAILLSSQITFGQVPTAAQLRWHDDEFYLFAHFGPNTFTDLEWGKGTESAEVFNPEKLDTKQWCRIAKQAGAAGIIITAKHHDGFCLWPSKYSKHTVRESKWRNGQGDVLKELSAACKEYGLKFGVYLSPWDRNHLDYGTPAYNQVFVNMMTEIFTNYGPIWEFWWDGANGEGPNGKRQEYDWNLFRATVKKLSPETVVFSDVGPHIRWVGNEKGEVNATNWNMLNTQGFTPGEDAPKPEVLNTGEENGMQWIPGECDVSIRPGWFYHQAEDAKVKSPEELFAIYLKSVGRGANLLLNVPPDYSGRFTSFDSLALLGFKKLRDENFKKNLLKDATLLVGSKKTKALTDQKPKTFVTLKKDESIAVNLKKEIAINCIQLREAIQFGQNVKKIKIQFYNLKGDLVREVEATTIGHNRLLTFPSVSASELKIRILESKSEAKFSEIAAYSIIETLVEK